MTFGSSHKERKGQRQRERDVITSVYVYCRFVEMDLGTDELPDFGRYLAHVILRYVPVFF